MDTVEIVGTSDVNLNDLPRGSKLTNNDNVHRSRNQVTMWSPGRLNYTLFALGRKYS